MTYHANRCWLYHFSCDSQVAEELAQAEGVSKLLVAQHEGYRGFLPGKPMPKCGALSVLPHEYPFRMITGSLIQSLSCNFRKRKTLKKSLEDLSCDTGWCHIYYNNAPEWLLWSVHELGNQDWADLATRRDQSYQSLQWHHGDTVSCANLPRFFFRVFSKTARKIWEGRREKSLSFSHEGDASGLLNGYGTEWRQMCVTYNYAMDSFEITKLNFMCGF